MCICLVVCHCIPAWQFVQLVSFLPPSYSRDTEGIKFLDEIPCLVVLETRHFSLSLPLDAKVEIIARKQDVLVGDEILLLCKGEQL